jgi:hypothetical protein
VPKSVARNPKWRYGYALSKDWLMSLKFAPGAALNPGKPVVLFEDKRDWSGYDLARDGRLLVARKAEEKGGGTQINVVLHWFDEMEAGLRK